MSQGKIVVIGSGPIRIGQGIEFDYCSVHCVWALREAGYEAIIVNNNPETVSTDFDTSDRLYFEPLATEDVLNILDREEPDGVIVQFGGQTAINLARPLTDAGIPIFGSSCDSIDLAEDRDRFEQILNELNISRPRGKAVTNADAAVLVAEEIGYPVLVRPSYVLGGRAMEVINDGTELRRYMQYVVDVSPKAPILVDKYILGKEVEVDVISDGVDCLLPGIMEHIERAGVHSGDSMAVYPPQTLTEHCKTQIVETATRLALRLKIIGLMNIQFVVDATTDTPMVLEVNPRASRTVPYLSKITGIPMVRVATKCMIGQTLKSQGYTSGLYPEGSSVYVKAPVFSFLKLNQVDIGLGPEMKSTGEIMGMDTEYPRALYKAMLASGIGIPEGGKMIVTLADSDKAEAVPIVQGFAELGFTVHATAGTADFLRQEGIETQTVKKLHEGEGNINDLIRSGQIKLLINTLSSDKRIEREASQIRRASVEAGVPCLTSLDTARALLLSLTAHTGQSELCVATVDEYLAGVK
ncbi:MAG: carbamoyl-phosphate synthase large subunit [Chthonomonadaceae bacterium]|nr:carbamoyl-phosphate synthase large subunit [Chthonomonadaceae bacterium]